MDKRYNTLSRPDQLALRRQAIDYVLSHPEWTLRESVCHLKRTMRLTSAEMAKLASVSTKTMQDTGQGRSDGTVQTMNRIFGMLGLKLGVVRRASQRLPSSSGPARPSPSRATSRPFAISSCTTARGARKTPSQLSAAQINRKNSS
ncbi:transcriptional regulator [Burkholderia sp. S-53]|uniref:transcriptional regulator n=1 Tax=Burkholderia sp. S-53 TaxID=2906514 RepID=UPI0021D2AE09|nr:transcriptional regulator [Burkholderia sp. S-53]UXU92196.1 transcriptional regulator [Burkholderia sp. S-53]